MNKNEILVSINCITYNHEKFIENTLKSFLNQKTNFKFEILIHDDASTDKTKFIIKEYAEKYPNIIKPIIQEENQYSKGIKRIGYLFNEKRAKGKYIAWCEGDDYWNDELKLQKQVDIMEKDEDISMCFHAAIIKDESTGVKREEHAYNKNCFASVKDIILKGGSFCPTASIIYPRKMMEYIPDFYMRAHVGDYPLQMILASLGKVYYIDETMAVYRTNVNGSWTKGILSGKDVFQNIVNNIENDIKLLEEFNEFTNFKYDEFVKIKIKECKFNILVINGDLKRLKSEKYINMFKNLSIKSKMKIYFRKNSPVLFLKLYNLKNKFR